MKKVILFKAKINLKFLGSNQSFAVSIIVSQSPVVNRDIKHSDLSLEVQHSQHLKVTTKSQKNESLDQSFWKKAQANSKLERESKFFLLLYCLFSLNKTPPNCTNWSQLVHSPN